MMWTMFIACGLALAGPATVLGKGTKDITPRAAGQSVVEATVGEVNSKCIFPDDMLFLRRTAWVETEDGLLGLANGGGIWNVTQPMFSNTKKSSLRTFTDGIKRAFNIDWTRTQWQELDKPLVSALAARLFVQSTKSQVPASVASQAQYWSTVYHPGASSALYIKETERLEQGCKHGMGVDMAFVLDASGSVGSRDFEKVKKFAQSFLDGFEISQERTHVSVMTYSTQPSVRWYLDEYYDKQTVINKIGQIQYGSGGSTNTGGALKKLIDDVFTENRGARSSRPQVAVVITDGQSNSATSTATEALRLRQKGVNVFAVGIGSNANQRELDTIASDPTCLHVFSVSNFDAISSITNAVNQRTCDAPIPITPGGDIEGTLPGDSDQNCQLRIPKEGVTVKISVKAGKLIYYTSRTSYPSEQFYDTRLSVAAGGTEDLFVPQPTTTDVEGIVYCNIKSDTDDDTDFEVGTKPGDSGSGSSKHTCPTAKYNDLCTSASVKANGFYFPHDNPNRYVQCDASGGCFERDCPSGLYWNVDKNTCDWGSGGSKCNTKTCLNGRCQGDTCVCDAGWHGFNCDIKMTPCMPNPCVEGTCVVKGDTFQCKCNAGWEGSTCRTPRDYCKSSPCGRHGNCTNIRNGFECCCDHGYTGKTCDTEIDECQSNPCGRHGTCVDGKNRYDCKCEPGWTGVHCTEEIDECESNPCQNNGECIDDINRYTCKCKAGWTGTHCETNIDECASHPCQNGATCEDKVNGYVCKCVKGFTGTHCEEDIDDCKPPPCNHGRCTDLVADYICTCDPGYTGRNCQTDINECASDPCVHGTCKDGVNGYTCNCQPGYTGTHCETEIDECQSNPCMNGGTCNDMLLKYLCQCKRGYTGTHCETPIDECQSDPCEHGECYDRINGFDCVCHSGWTGTNCDCVIDNCAVRPPPCKHGVCTNYIGGHTCVCDPGYSGSDCSVGPPGGGGTCDSEHKKLCNGSPGPNKNFHFPNYKDSTKFIQCDKWGGCWNMPCSVGTVWRDGACSHP